MYSRIQLASGTYHLGVKVLGQLVLGCLIIFKIHLSSHREDAKGKVDIRKKFI